jgi:hypothetical protein
MFRYYRENLFLVLKIYARLPSSALRGSPYARASGELYLHRFCRVWLPRAMLKAYVQVLPWRHVLAQQVQLVRR